MSNDILKEAREAFDLCAEVENDNRREFLEDLRFARMGEQWPDQIRQQREREGRPCLTLNKLPVFIRQVVNDARQNKPACRIHPQDSGADPHTAEVLTGLVRNIEVTSDADVAYDTAIESAVTGGFGYWTVNTQYACDDGFEQDIAIERVSNPLSIYGDPYSNAADSSDWDTAFQVEMLSKDRFEREYKGADPVNWEEAGTLGLPAPWVDGDEVMIARYWRRDKVKDQIIALSDGQVVKVSEYERNKALFDALQLAPIGQSREINSHQVTLRVMTGAEELSKVDWAGKYIPIVPVYGDEVVIEGRRHFRSLIRDAKDPQRMFNYWRTMATELVALAPKAPFIGPKGAFDTDHAKWQTANTHNHPYLEYDGPRAPERNPFAGMPAGALQEALNASDDMKAITGIYDASLGARSNETSGVAINARKLEGDVSTFHFIDNLSRAIRHSGRIVLDLIPKVYTTERMIRVLGEDMTPQTVQIAPGAQPQQQGGAPGVADASTAGNVPSGPLAAVSRVHDLTVGKYDLTVTAGPSFTSRREEAAAQMQEWLRASPELGPIIGDIVAKNLDWPGADEIAERLKIMLPPEIKAAMGEGPTGESPTGPSIPPELAQQMEEGMALIQQLRAENQQLQQAAGAKQQEMMLKAKELEIRSQELGIKGYEAETARMTATQPQVFKSPYGEVA